jgi:hypothetical protein
MDFAIIDWGQLPFGQSTQQAQHVGLAVPAVKGDAQVALAHRGINAAAEELAQNPIEPSRATIIMVERHDRA